jgi:hypothetical protein
MFAPINEFDYALGVNRSSDWGQEILPKIKEKYHGKIVWKGALNYGRVEDFNINFKGYDFIGSTILVGDNDFDSFRNNTKKQIDTIRNFAERDGVKGVMITEFGIAVKENKKYLSEEDYVKSFQIIFEEGNGKISGYFVTDMPDFLGPPLRGSQREESIKEWYRERLP